MAYFIKNRKRTIPDINAGSMADIAFLLLTFFLLATTMKVETGLQRKIPPYNQDTTKEEVQTVLERNIFLILINYKNEIAIQGELVNISIIKQKVKEFIENKKNLPDFSEGVLLSERRAEYLKTKNTNEANRLQGIINLIGNSRISKGIISIQCDRSSKYNIYLKIQSEIIAAFDELKDEFAMQQFGKHFEKLDNEIQEAIREKYPVSISEAETDFGGK